MWVAGAHGDGPGLHIVVIDVPAIGAVGRSAAGKGRRFGHGGIETLERELGKHARRLSLIGREVGAYSKNGKGGR